MLVKRFMSYMLSIALILSCLIMPTYVQAADDGQYFDFADLAQSYPDGKIPSTQNDTNYRVWNGINYVDDTTPYRQVYLAENAEGSREIVLKCTSSHNYFGFAINKTTQRSGIIELACKLKIDDLLATRTFGSYESSNNNNKWLMKIVANSGAMYVVGKGLTKKAEAGDVLDAIFTVNLSTGDARAVIKRNGDAWIDETNTVDNYTQTWNLNNAYRYIFMYQHGYIGTNNAPAVSHWSDIYIGPARRHYNASKEDFDFEDFHSVATDGTAAPTDFATGGSGVYSENTIRGMSVKLEADGCIEKPYTISTDETAYVEFSVLRPDNESGLYVKSDNGEIYLNINNDGNLKVLDQDTELVLSESNKWYDIKLAINAADKLAYAEVYGSDGLIGSKLVKNEDMDMTASNISFVSNTQSSVYIDDITLFATETICEPGSEEPLDIAYSTPVTGSKAPVGTPVKAVFNQAVNSSTFSEITVNGTDVTANVSYEDENTVIFPSVLDEEGKDYIIKFKGSNFEDYIEIKATSARKEKDVIPVRLISDSGKLKAYTAVENNTTDNLEYIFVFSNYLANGALKDFKFEKSVISDGGKGISLELPYDTSSYYEAYVIDSSSNHALLTAISTEGSAPDFYVEGSSSEIEFTAGADEKVWVTGINSLDIGSGFVVLKSDLSEDALVSSGAECVEYLKFFDSSFNKNAFSFPVDEFGNFKVLYVNNGIEGNTNFFMLSNKEKKDILDYINSDAFVWEDILTERNCKGMRIDGALYFSLADSKYTDKFSASVIEQREAMPNGEFTAIDEFKDVYYAAIIPQLLTKADIGSKVKEIVDTHSDVLKLDCDPVAGSDAYNTFNSALLTDSARDDVWETLSKLEYDYIKDIYEPFRETIILSAIENIENNVNINKIITDNNSWLGFDMSNYNALTDKASVNDAIGGKSYSTIEELKEVFEELSANPSEAEDDDDDDDKTYNPGKGGSTSVSLPSGSASGGLGNGNSGTQASSQVNTPAFKDTTSVPWAEVAIEYMYKKGIINGKSADSFAPNDMITRAEYIKLLAESFFPNDFGTGISFTDVPTDSWFYPYVAIGVKNGITFGKNDGSFGANEPINRQDMAVMLARAAKIAISEGFADFSDIGSVSDYAKGYVSALYNMGIVNGMGDGTYQPMSTATRAQAAVMIYNYLTKGAR